MKEARWSELFPHGRWLFYEGNDPKGFAREMQETFKLNVKGSGYTKRAGYQFICPAQLLDTLYGNGKYPLGS